MFYRRFAAERALHSRPRAMALAIIKCLIALGAAAVLAHEVLSSRRARWQRWVSIACAVAAVLAYFPVRSAAGNGFVHRWEMFHYYVGAKYHAELGYKGLYACVAAADAEARVPGATTRRIRDLATDGITTSRAAIAAARCETRFSAARWSSFRADVAEFRKLAGSRRQWERMQLDHGYNPPPLWTTGGRAVTALGPPTLALLTALASIDVLLMVGIALALGWGFGTRIALLGIVFWGTQAAAEFGWTGGGLLRQDWLFLSVLALALLRRGYPLAAGAALTTAALLRVFPALLGIGLLVTMAASVMRSRRVSAQHARIAIGALGSALVLGVLSAVIVGADAYPRFFEHIQLRHTSAISNHMGLRTLFAFSTDATLADLADPKLFDPGLPWAAARQARLAEFELVYELSAGLFVAAVVFVAARLKTAWMAVALSLPLIPALTDPSCYYYSVWVLAVVLVRARASLGVPLLGLAAGGQLLTLRFSAYDERFAALALLYVISALVLLLAFMDSPAARVSRWLTKTRTRSVRIDLRRT